MKTIYKLNKNPKSNKEIYNTIMKVKSLIDTICEQKGIYEDHDLITASNSLNSFLDSLEEQFNLRDESCG